MRRRSQIKTIMQAQRTTMRPLMLQMAQNRQAMLTATASGAFDQAKVQALATQQAQIMSQLAVQKASVHSQIYNTVLTPEQKATADQLRQKQLARISQRIAKLSQPASEAQLSSRARRVWDLRDPRLQNRSGPQKWAAFLRDSLFALRLWPEASRIFTI